MTSDTLYEVRADNGLGGFVLGREAADELLTVLGNRADVSSVEATPIRGEEFVNTSADLAPRVVMSVAETLAYLGHGEQL